MVLSHMQLFSYAYNFIQYHIVDTARAELYPHDIAHPYRELMMHVWIPVAEKPCPLILFSHGLGDNFNGMTYTQLCQYCANQGYVVASVSHTYGCKPVRFPDGKIASYFFPAPFHRQSGRHMFDIEADVWVDDMICALNECEKHNNDSSSLLYQKIDMMRIGIMGHSLGGAVAINVGRKDNRIKVVINLDGPLFGTHVTVPLEKPLMVIIGSSVTQNPATFFLGGVPFHKEFVWRGYFNQYWLPTLNAFIHAQYRDAHKIVIDRIVHGTFSDEALYPDSVLVPFIMNGEQAHKIIYGHVRDFFDQYFYHQPSS
jgi:hypothetical protein